MRSYGGRSIGRGDAAAPGPRSSPGARHLRHRLRCFRDRRHSAADRRQSLRQRRGGGADQPRPCPDLRPRLAAAGGVVRGLAQGAPHPPGDRRIRRRGLALPAPTAWRCCWSRGCSRDSAPRSMGPRPSRLPRRRRRGATPGSPASLSAPAPRSSSAGRSAPGSDSISAGPGASFFPRHAPSAPCWRLRNVACRRRRRRRVRRRSGRGCGRAATTAFITGAPCCARVGLAAMPQLLLFSGFGSWLGALPACGLPTVSASRRRSWRSSAAMPSISRFFP